MTSEFLVSDHLFEPGLEWWRNSIPGRGSCKVELSGHGQGYKNAPVPRMDRLMGWGGVGRRVRRYIEIKIDDR